ncbi:hypothetical protein PCAR4_1200008 [Paraburkholderia caribensis]|nr:hypothetical protein PCAR4_1200008 [Paraburkholderia caribensis]
MASCWRRFSSVCVRRCVPTSGQRSAHASPFEGGKKRTPQPGNRGARRDVAHCEVLRARPVDYELADKRIVGTVSAEGIDIGQRLRASAIIGRQADVIAWHSISMYSPRRPTPRTC